MANPRTLMQPMPNFERAVFVLFQAEYAHLIPPGSEERDRRVCSSVIYSSQEFVAVEVNITRLLLEATSYLVVRSNLS